MDHLEQDAHEFGLHIRQGGWRLGLLVARNVEKGKESGRNDRYGRAGGTEVKVSAQEFGRQSGTSAPRVLRYLTAWEKAAEVGVVPPAATLSPGQEVELDGEKLPSWSEFYTATERVMASTSLIAGGLKTASEEKLKTVVDALPLETRAALAREALADPAVAQEVVSDAGTRLNVEAASERVRDANRGQMRSERTSLQTGRVTQSDIDGAGVMRLTAVSSEIGRSWSGFAHAWRDVFPTLSGDAQEAAYALLDSIVAESNTTAEKLRGGDVEDAINRILEGGRTT